VNAVSAFTAKKKGYSVLRDEGGILWMFEDDKKEARNASVGVRTKIFLKRMVMSRSFFYFGGFLVLLDMIFMCLRSFEASQEILELVGKCIFQNLAMNIQECVPI
jgi:hypothetical protein